MARAHTAWLLIIVIGVAHALHASLYQSGERHGVTYAGFGKDVLQAFLRAPWRRLALWPIARQPEAPSCRVRPYRPPHQAHGGLDRGPALSLASRLGGMPEQSWPASIAARLGSRSLQLRGRFADEQAGQGFHICKGS